MDGTRNVVQVRTKPKEPRKRSKNDRKAHVVTEPPGKTVQPLGKSLHFPVFFQNEENATFTKSKKKKVLDIIIQADFRFLWPRPRGKRKKKMSFGAKGLLPDLKRIARFPKHREKSSSPLPHRRNNSSPSETRFLRHYPETRPTHTAHAQLARFKEDWAIRRLADFSTTANRNIK